MNTSVDLSGEADCHTENPRDILFGRFRLVPHRYELLADGVPVPIGCRALDILMVLIEARGELVTKDELMNRVWPSLIVEENTLQFHISMIRKALGEDRGCIKTISGRGYRFLADIARPAGQQTAVPEAGTGPIAQLADLLPAGNLPAVLSDLVGREVQLADVADLFRAHRLVTLVGVGGIGKTRLGLEAVRCLQPNFADGVWVVALGSLSDPKLVLPTVTAVLGQSDSLETPGRLATALASKHFLLMLDNCEHVIDVAAGIAEAFLQASATVQVLATSREPLGLAGEYVYRVPALDVPAEGTTDIEDVSSHSAVRLFFERTGAIQRSLRLDAHVVTAATAICRRLDGIPLAIEFAAGRAATLGVHGLASRLDDPFKLLTEGHRTAPARHQTLRATLDWSYELLSEPERAVMRRLSIFAGEFTIEAAVSVAAIAETTASNVVNCLAGLVTKSLVATDVGSMAVRYRLLETIRTYVVEKLAGSSDLGQVARRYAALNCDRCEPTAIDWPRLPSDGLFYATDRDMDNMHDDLKCASFAKDEAATVLATAAA